MASRSVDVLLVGGGLASASCAALLRREGFEGSILLVGREPHPPYNRPPVSKGYLQGKESRDDALVRPLAWYEENDVELLERTSVTKLDAAARTALLSTKDEVSFGQALLATGANVRRLPVDGSDLEGIHYLRALGNADALRADLEEAERVAIVGGSYIGTEVAASVTALGKRAAIVMQEGIVHERGFGATAGRFFQGVLEQHGVEVHGGEGLARFEGAGQRVQRLVCESGRVVECDAVVLGVGAVPEVSLARAAGLEIGERGGVVCDSRLRTSADGIFAAGDICEYDSVVHGRRLRIEHWDVAREQGRTAARNIAGGDAPHEAVPYFFSDLADWTSLEYVGPASSWDAEVTRGSIDDGEFSHWYLEDGRVVAALSVGRSEDLDAARRLIASHEPVDPARLADASAELP
ncbi:MAG TPA: FAD-dependent oxidoreductase [Solirubrobacteraceae bacterium]|nr:FAD-dependent oxidoreductase [Solirubrobacteraceae bacterium]